MHRPCSENASMWFLVHSLACNQLARWGCQTSQHLPALTLAIMMCPWHSVSSVYPTAWHCTCNIMGNFLWHTLRLATKRMVKPLPTNLTTKFNLHTCVKLLACLATPYQTQSSSSTPITTGISIFWPDIVGHNSIRINEAPMWYL